MLRFARLVDDLETRAGAAARAEALDGYWQEVPDEEVGWAAHLLLGGSPARLVTPADLRAWVSAEAGLDDWLIDASTQSVGDPIEALALMLPTDVQSGSGHALADLCSWFGRQRTAWCALGPDLRRATWARWSRSMPPTARALWWRLLVGAWRARGVNREEVIASLARHTQTSVPQAAWTLAGVGRAWPPAGERCLRTALRHPEAAAPLPWAFPALNESKPSPAGPPPWSAFAWPPGLRAQWVRRGGRVALWSPEDRLLNHAFPDVLRSLADAPDGSVVEGVITSVASSAGPAPAWDREGARRLALRLSRKAVGATTCRTHPATFVPVDVLAWAGTDLRDLPPLERWALLDGPVAESCRARPPLRWEVQATDALATHLRRALNDGGEALWLRGCGAGAEASLLRPPPQRVRAVLLYAQASVGRGRSSGGECTFAIWSRPPVDPTEASAVADALARREPARPGGLQLVAFARSPWPDDEGLRDRVDQWVRQHTVERFGPVRVVRPGLVFELGFDGLDDSPKHKSGVVARGLQLLAWLPDASLTEVSHLTNLRQRQFKAD